MAEVLLAFDSFKGSIRAADAALAFAEGWNSVRPDDSIVHRPMADGGEGTLDALTHSGDGTVHRATVTGPLDDRVEAEWRVLPDGTAVIELAGVCGLEHFAHADDLRPLDAHTFGLGELVAHALAAGATRVAVTLGGSASTEGGTGLLRGLGARFLDADDRPVALGARGLESIARVDLSGLIPLPDAGVVAITDVDNPLTGPAGAARVFGPQKGLAAADIDPTDAALLRLADLLGIDPATPSLGAAGGTTLGLVAWGATVRGGAEAIGDLVGLPAAVATADVVVTGEGSFDAQSARGKVPAFVAGLASSADARVSLVAGRITDDADTSAFEHSVSLTELAGSSEAAIANPREWLRRSGQLLAADYAP